MTVLECVILPPFGSGIWPVHPLISRVDDPENSTATSSHFMRSRKGLEREFSKIWTSL